MQKLLKLLGNNFVWVIRLEYKYNKTFLYVDAIVRIHNLAGRPRPQGYCCGLNVSQNACGGNLIHILFYVYVCVWVWYWDSNPVLKHARQVLYIPSLDT